jgi:hypothetical protein
MVLFFFILQELRGRSPSGGLEGRRPSKNHPFLVLFAGLAGKEHEK